jgi:hypothetical protein
MLVEAAAREQGSGLGLGRICAEAEMRLEAAVDADRVTVSAQLLEDRAEPWMKL